MRSCGERWSCTLHVEESSIAVVLPLIRHQWRLMWLVELRRLGSRLGSRVEDAVAVVVEAVAARTPSSARSRLLEVAAELHRQPSMELADAVSNEVVDEAVAVALAVPRVDSHNFKETVTRVDNGATVREITNQHYCKLKRRQAGSLV